MKTMKLMVCVVAASGVFGAASAQDIWNGYYYGIHVGAGQGTASIRNEGADTSWAGPGQVTEFDIDGGLIGGHFGYLTQTGNNVLGYEISADLADISERRNSPFVAWHDYQTKIKNQVQLSARAGTVQGNWMFFVRGGLSAGQVSFHGYDMVFPNSYDQTEWHLGVHAGVGAERKLNERMSLGLDLTYTDFGSKSGSGEFRGGGVPPKQIFAVDAASTVLSMRLNYAF